MKTQDGSAVANVVRMARFDLKSKVHREQRKRNKNSVFPGDEATFIDIDRYLSEKWVTDLINKLRAESGAKYDTQNIKTTLKNLTKEHFDQLAEAIRNKLISEDPWNGSLGYLKNQKQILDGRKNSTEDSLLEYIKYLLG